jgi:competence protein ComEC
MAHNEQRLARAKAWAAEIDAARRRAGLIIPDGLAERAAWLRRALSEWAIAEVAPGRLVPWLPVAFILSTRIASAPGGLPQGLPPLPWPSVLQFPVASAGLSGFVEIREERDRSDRIVLRVHHIEGRRLNVAPGRVRLAVRKGTASLVGSFVELKARLTPPLAPLRSGGDDFAPDMYFQRIGASGYALGPIKTLTPPASPGFWLR